MALFATVRDVYADRPEGVTIYGMFSSMLAFVPALGPIASAIIADRFGWRMIFMTLGILGLLSLLNALLRWHETRPTSAGPSQALFGPIMRSPEFWCYTLGFSAAMGTFFVFFSTAPRILVAKGGYSELEFSLAFATAALVMIVTARFAKVFVVHWGIGGSLVRGMSTLLVGSLLLTIGQVAGSPSFLSFVMPMWVMAIGIVLTVSVTANGALRNFDDTAGSAVALYFCVQSLMVGIVGTLAVIALRGDTAWPLIAYSSSTALLTLVAMGLLEQRTRS